MASPFDQLSGASVLDTAHVIAFAGGDFALALDLLQDFLATLDFHMRLLDAALVADDWREDAHRLKGAACSIGAMRLGALAAMADQNGIAWPDLQSQLRLEAAQVRDRASAFLAAA